MAAFGFDMTKFMELQQQQMLEQRDPATRELKKALVASLEESYEPTVQKHEVAIRELKAQPNGATVNEAAIKRHEARIAFYQS
jgi:hypothetical protein